MGSSKEALHIIDGLLYHETDMKIEEHITLTDDYV
ncbi:TPA: Tn3 family transposase [Bacillus toyonensis]|nr:Tn3 family transposase [Bacillus toyonensis]